MIFGKKKYFEYLYIIGIIFELENYKIKYIIKNIYIENKIIWNEGMI